MLLEANNSNCIQCVYFTQVVNKLLSCLPKLEHYFFRELFLYFVCVKGSTHWHHMTCIQTPAHIVIYICTVHLLSGGILMQVSLS